MRRSPSWISSHVSSQRILKADSWATCQSWSLSYPWCTFLQLEDIADRYGRKIPILRKSKTPMHY
jgi:hypothetical protein